MSHAREAILRRLRDATGRETLPRAGAPPLAPATRRPIDVCVARFREEAAALGVTCYVEATAADVRARLGDLVGGRTVVSWDPSELPYGTGALMGGAVRGDAAREVLAAADVGVTGCHAAIAETASLALFSAPGCSRAVSLLPPVHVAVVERARLCYSLAEFFEAQASRIATAASCTLVTGPSRTADIELTLTLGIHGPGEVLVILGP